MKSAIVHKIFSCIYLENNIHIYSPEIKMDLPIKVAATIFSV